MPASTLTPAQRESIREYVSTHHIPAGLGTKEAACSIAAVNLALTGELTDKIPECMSPAVGEWIIRIQDSMPDSIRNSQEWKDLLPFAAGTGRDKEAVRRDLILGWMRGALAGIQDVADKGRFGKEWAVMVKEKAYAAYAYAAAVASASASASAAAVAVAAVAASADDDFWARLDPAGLLKQLIDA